MCSKLFARRSALRIHKSSVHGSVKVTQDLDLFHPLFYSTKAAAQIGFLQLSLLLDYSNTWNQFFQLVSSCLIHGTLMIIWWDLNFQDRIFRELCKEPVESMSKNAVLKGKKDEQQVINKSLIPFSQSFLCPECGAAFKANSALIDHRKRVHLQVHLNRWVS